MSLAVDMTPSNARQNERPDELTIDVTLEELVEAPGPPRGEASFVGRYRLCFELSSGGMASVYLARVDGPANFQKLVALKRIHPHLAKVPEFVEMFLDEAALAARIDHPNVCSVVDFGREGESYFLTMEYLVGEPLSRIIKVARKREPESWAHHGAMIARIVADACEGLHAAHELCDAKGDPLNVVHRDISPDNIFVTYDGVPKIVDFGVASARDRIHKTSTGLLKGKHAYMAPEVLEGAALDRRVDVWGMGVVLWEALCQRRLFRRRSEAETLYAVVGGDIAQPSSVRPGLPKPLDAVVMSALTRDASERCPNARELANALRRFLNALDEPVGSPEVAAWLDGLFPGGRQRKRELMDLALSLPDTVPTLPSVGDADADTGSAVSATALVRRARLRRRAPWLAGIAAVVGLSVGALVWAGLPQSGGRPHSETSTRVASAFADRGEPAGTPMGRDSLPSSAAAPSVAAGGPQQAAAADASAPSASARREASAPPDPSPPTEQPARGAPDPPERRAPSERTETSASAEARTRRTQHGTAVVLVPPDVHWAHVYHRGRRLPHTAPGSFRLPAGRQILEVRFMGQTPGQRVVANVRGGRSVTVRAGR